MSNKDTVSPETDTAVSGPSPFAHPHAQPNGANHADPDTEVELFPIDADRDIASSTDNEAVPAESIMDRLTVNGHDDSPDDSLNEMVQSILNDSDTNEVILSNMNMMGYNNMPSHWNDNENTATNAFAALPSSERSKAQMNIDDDNKLQSHDKALSSTNTPTPAPTPNTTTTTSSQAPSDRRSVSRSSRRKYMLEWRTVVFIRHGKSKWNAAEGDPLSKVMAAGKGYIEYWKTKKLSKLDSNRNGKKSEVDIMDAPLSREGIMEAVNLCTYLREYTRDTQLTHYNELFERTRSEMDDILQTMASTAAATDEGARQEMTDKMKECLRRLDAFKVESLVAKHPPQDDDNLRLPQPVSEIPKSPAVIPLVTPAADPVAEPTPTHSALPVTVESANIAAHHSMGTVAADDDRDDNGNGNTEDEVETPVPSTAAADKESKAEESPSRFSIGSSLPSMESVESNPNSTKLDAVRESVEAAPDHTRATLNATNSLRSIASMSPSAGAVPVDAAPDGIPTVDLGPTPRRTESVASVYSEMATPTLSPRGNNPTVSFMDFVATADDPAANGDGDGDGDGNGNGHVVGNEENSSSAKPKVKSPKRYMQPIPDPQSPMDAEYVVDLLNGNKAKCGIVVSNLRRAMSTACICLNDRLERRPYEKIQILGCLQEIGLNADTRPLLSTKDHKPILSKLEKTTPLLRGVSMEQIYAERLSTKYYKGDAADKTAQQRLQEFALWLFAQRKYQHVVAIGHSHWFQSFFKAYLPVSVAEEDLPAKVRTSKIRNCGVVAFRIQKRYVCSKTKRHGRHISFEIHPASITTLKFSLYGRPRTNHEEMKEKSLSEEFESDIDTEQELEFPLGPQSLPQSRTVVATTKTPGILAQYPEGPAHDDVALFDTANLKDDAKPSDHSRPRIPDNSPPPVPPSNDAEDPHNTQFKERKDSSEKKSFRQMASFSRPKGKLMAFMSKIGGGVSDKEDKEKEKEVDKEEQDAMELAHDGKASDIANGNEQKGAINPEDKWD